MGSAVQTLQRCGLRRGHSTDVPRNSSPACPATAQRAPPKVKTLGDGFDLQGAVHKGQKGRWRLLRVLRVGSRGDRLRTAPTRPRSSAGPSSWP